MRPPSLLLAAFLASPALVTAQPASPPVPLAPHEVTIDWIFGDEVDENL